jgi:hypothetical protein
MESKYNFYRKDDTFNGRKYTFPFDLTGAVILCQFKVKPALNVVTFEYKSEDGSITVPTPTNGEIFFQPRRMSYPTSIYYYDIQITFSNGTVKTYAQDKLEIFQDVSRL